MTATPAILVVDDEIVNRAVASATLKNHDWRVDEAQSGTEAIERIASTHYALVLMDIQMAEMDGLAATRLIREREDGVRVPIIAFTAMKHEDIWPCAEAAGMDGYIGKPFTADTLLQAVTPWRPDPAQGAARLSAIFGAAEIAALLGNFAAQVAEALTVEEDGPARRARAHKIAGVAGTLGYSDLSAAMLRVSEGDDAGWPDARREARKMLATMPD